MRSNGEGVQMEGREFKFVPQPYLNLPSSIFTQPPFEPLPLTCSKLQNLNCCFWNSPYQCPGDDRVINVLKNLVHQNHKSS